MSPQIAKRAQRANSQRQHTCPHNDVERPFDSLVQHWPVARKQQQRLHVHPVRPGPGGSQLGGECRRECVDEAGPEVLQMEA